MKRYLRLVFCFAKNCFIRELEFRFNFVVWSLLNFFNLGILILTTNLVFNQVQNIGGWTKDLVILLIITSTIVEDCLWTFVIPSLGDFVSSIPEGRLDFVLQKPVSQRFLLSARFYVFDHLFPLVVMFIFLHLQLTTINIHPGLLQWALYLISLILGIFVLYNFMFATSSLSIWFTKIFNINILHSSITEIGRYPGTIFAGKLRVVMYYLLPAAFVAYYPVRFLTGQSAPVDFPVVVAASVFSSAVSQLLWRYALRYYSGASS